MMDDRQTAYININDRNSDYHKIDIEFENTCIKLKEGGESNPKGLTVIEFFSLVEYLKKSKK